MRQDGEAAGHVTLDDIVRESTMCAFTLSCKDSVKVTMEGPGRLAFPRVTVGTGVSGKRSERALRLILIGGLPI